MLTLQNDLVVALVSDNTTIDAATSVDVGVGHFSDPRAQEGLAHFLEHMVFISNAKYPVENSYFAFLAERNGGANAFTASNHTNFYFEVDPDELRGGMDRLANFFISPTFPVNQVGREKHAVDSEHAKNLKNDAWRAAQLLRSLAAPSSVVSKFGTGSLRTLGLSGDAPLRSQARAPPAPPPPPPPPHLHPFHFHHHHVHLHPSLAPPLRPQLVDFYEEHYVAPQMAVAIVGKQVTRTLIHHLPPLHLHHLHLQDLDTLEAWAVECFGGVPARRRVKRAATNVTDGGAVAGGAAGGAAAGAGAAAAADEEVNLTASGKAAWEGVFPSTPRAVLMKPSRTMEEVAVFWSLPGIESKTETLPGQLLGYLLGQESKGSLTAELVKRGWATGLSAVRMPSVEPARLTATRTPPQT